MMNGGLLTHTGVKQRANNLLEKQCKWDIKDNDFILCPMFVQGLIIQFSPAAFLKAAACLKVCFQE